MAMRWTEEATNVRRALQLEQLGGSVGWRVAGVEKD